MQEKISFTISCTYLCKISSLNCSPKGRGQMTTHTLLYVCYIVYLFQPFALNPDELPIIFATEVVKPNIKAKDHLVLQVGEQLMILLTSHDKLPDGKYLCEKSDGTSEFLGSISPTNVKLCWCIRVVGVLFLVWTFQKLCSL